MLIEWQLVNIYEMMVSNAPDGPPSYNERLLASKDIRSCLIKTYWINFLLQGGRLDEICVGNISAFDLRHEVLGSGSNDIAKSPYFTTHLFIPTYNRNTGDENKYGSRFQSRGEYYRS